MKGGPSKASVSERTGGLGLAPGQDVEGRRRRRAPARYQKDGRARDKLTRVRGNDLVCKIVHFVSFLQEFLKFPDFTTFEQRGFGAAYGIGRQIVDELNILDESVYFAQICRFWGICFIFTTGIWALLWYR